ncbi:zinc-binding alcohol dehydrogenase family protein [Porifericola rhodea]|uniref:zinc-binding alcohol dehydrogenase family protein n=1 Tax=Porifericola rhodea TaxID=930972 RepID=UPI0026666170|nr:zinc-binding alcohol dehydrogenase family protein [Porifericola rhodea]WKN33292.1 zinc-binding alcohol dehydrogenase family protein [Porifericola rhodea]
MKAIGIKKSLPISDDNSFIVFETEKPRPKGHDLLVKVKAVSVNPVDYKVRQNSAKDKELDSPKILGWDAVGVIEAVGDEVTLFGVGEEVYYAGDITRPGSNAEYQLIDERIVGKRPASLSLAEAAAMPLTSLTAWEAIFERLLIKRQKGEGQNILIIGGAGGVGSIAIQILKEMTKLNVIATASRDETRDWCLKMGADEVANHHNLAESVKKTGHRQIDYILNFADTDGHWDAMAELIKPQGRICSIVENKGELNLSAIRSKSVAFCWELMFTRAMYQTDDMIEQHYILNSVADLLEQELIKPTLNITLKGFTVDNFREAHRILESGKAIGKIAIVFDDEK